MDPIAQSMRRFRMWRRSVNNSGRKGTNIPLDENILVLTSLRMLFRDFLVQKVHQHQYWQMLMTASNDCYDQANTLLESLKRDLNKLVKRAVEFNIFTKLEERSYKQFSSFKRYRLANFDASSLHHWINKHRKKHYLGN